MSLGKKNYFGLKLYTFPIESVRKEMRIPLCLKIMVILVSIRNRP